MATLSRLTQAHDTGIFRGAGPSIGVNAGADLRALRSVMEQNLSVDPAIVLDPATKLRQYVKEAARTAQV